jgi:hypothetical protein
VTARQRLYIKLVVNNVPAVLAGTNLIAAVILEQSKVREQGEEGEAKTLLSGRPLLSPAIDRKTLAALLAKLHGVSAGCCF